MTDLTSRLAAYAREIECVGRLVPLKDWPNDVAHVLGWIDPFFEGDEVVLTFCPERINDSLKMLTDEGVDSYFDMMEFIISGIVMDMDEGATAETVEALRKKVEATLWDLKPAAMEALNAIQMEILDELLAS